MFSGRTCVLSTVIGYLVEACVDKGDLPVLGTLTLEYRESLSWKLLHIWIKFG